MDVSESDDDMNFIKRPSVFFVHPPSDDDESRPVTPPMDESLKLSKSLGVILSPQSPPCRRIRTMKLIESPVSFYKSRLETPFTSTPTPSPCAQSIIKRAPKATLKSQRTRLSQLYQTDGKDKSLNNPTTPPYSLLNPFTTSRLTDVKSKKRTKSSRLSYNKSFTYSSDDYMDMADIIQEQDLSQLDVKKPRLSEFNLPRYKQEFIELEVIGTGVHGCVFKCLNKLNGVFYAVKRGLKPINNERIAHNEIYAHGILQHPNIVRNYSNWTENDYVYMQNEYCNGGSLEDLIKSGPLDERELRKILEHVAQGLRFIHSKHLAHMDIKPGNILRHRDSQIFYKSCDIDDFCEDDESNEETVYKIGDLGHVTRLDDVVDVEEGDCRYLPKDILNDDYSNLTKVDIFALGLTLYEAAGSGPLPKNGEEWHNIRDGKIKTFSHFCNEFNNLIKRMIHPDPDCRPSASELLSQTVPSPIYKTVKDKHELKAAKQKIHLLEAQLQDMLKCVKVLRSQSDNKRQVAHNNNKGERLVGKKYKRSQSTTIF